ncbi:MAG TPA: hypothetical protein PKU90_01230 [Candidatus Paceibacterota bacterium]|nr:hypothetical protein [Candidatus Paceibacterota bacterium]
MHNDIIKNQKTKIKNFKTKYSPTFVTEVFLKKISVTNQGVFSTPLNRGENKKALFYY